MEFTQLYANRSSTLKRLSILISQATEAFPLESLSANNIQRLYRGSVVRALLSIKRKAATNIQRTYRGSVGRAVRASRATNKSESEEIAVFHYHAMILQRTFRGFYSRRYHHDYSARKAYIQSVVSRGEKLRDKLEQNLVEQRRMEAEEEIKSKAEEFRKVTANLHHLLSTKSMPGIYNSPYVADNPPTAMGIPVEDHLRVGVKDLIRTRMKTVKKLSVDLNGTKRIPIKVADSRLSVQASSKYDAVQEAEKMDAKLGKTRWASKRNFIGGGKTADPVYQRGVSEGTHYLDSWKNPFFQRGEPLKEGEVPPGPGLPFYTSVGGNKSSVQPNGVFDVILDAELHGGVTNRKLVRETVKRMQSENGTSFVTGDEGFDDGTLIIPETA